MKGRTHALAQQLTGKQSLEECSVQELKQLAQRHPYFAPAQFLLLQKLRQEGPSEEADAQYKKAILYYSNPLQFELFIASGKFFGKEAGSSDSDSLVVAPINNENSNINFERDTAPEDVTVHEESPVQFIGNEHPKESNEAAADVLEQPPVATEEPQAIAAEIIEVVPVTTEEEEHEQHEAVSSTPEESLPVEQTHSATDLEEENKPKVENEAAHPLAFEPFHTVDYFASQGIKISQEELPKDKLGKQMKSFTEWLKSMKRLPASQITEAVESTAERKVESMASHSVSDSEVVTEAMAEVWAKQGNSAKALDIYNKLVLLNPSKKAYFAAKIETLKQS